MKYLNGVVNNWIDNKYVKSDIFFEKLDPTTGKPLYRVARSGEVEINEAVQTAKEKYDAWAQKTPVYRADILRNAAMIMMDRIDEIAEIVHIETGKSLKEAKGETNGAIEMGMFVAGEGRRFYGHTVTSANENKMAMTIRQPIGLAGLIIAANTPIANVAWKAFPALLCGDTVVLKASEDTPATALFFAEILKEAGLPGGVFNVIHGLGDEAGIALVKHEDVDILSFTGSCRVGKIIQQECGKRTAKVCLELGGKNALVVCDDADLDLAVKWTVLSAFSNAGQRCAAGSRVIIFESIYEKFKSKLVEETNKLSIGNSNEDDLGPVINEKQLNGMLAALTTAQKEGATITVGGRRLQDEKHAGGFYLEPTIVEDASLDAQISNKELFGPITCLYKVKDYNEAVDVANNSEFGLTAAIHTKDINRALSFIPKIQTGVVTVNGGTYGSEPHLPFGGLKQSGNGMREAGMEALDVYSDWKTIYINYNSREV